MPTLPSVPTCYPVETSGWDLDENFFVEKTYLEWSEAEKTILLQHQIRRDAVIFVRLLGITSPDDIHSVAYEAVDVNYQSQLHSYKVLLVQLLPRMPASTLIEAQQK